MSSLVDQLMQQVDASGPGATVSSRERGERLVLGLSSYDQLAVAVTELRLETDRLAGASADRVAEVAKLLTDRVSYLLEPLTPVEIDRELAIVQLRSTDPTTEDQVASYYELLVRTGGSITMRRYRKPRGVMREPIDATLTREVLRRLAGDLLAAVGAA